jgi:hypothetical protein
MASKAATSSGDSAPKTGGRLQRSRSAEDLSREKLKSTENDTVIIFIEYVRKKLGNTTPRTADLDEAIERERRQRETRSHSGREGKKEARVFETTSERAKRPQKLRAVETHWQ